MLLNIVLDGHESPKQLDSIVRALNAYAGLGQTTHKIGDVSVTRIEPVNPKPPSQAALVDGPNAQPMYPTAASAPTASVTNAASAPELVDMAALFGGVPSTAVAGPPPNVPAPMPATSTQPTAPPPLAPTPAPVANAPSASAAPANPASDVDAQGIRWDARIHSAERGKKADNTWRRRRNIDDATYNAVLTELRGGAAPTQQTLPSIQGVSIQPLIAPPPPIDDGRFASMIQQIAPHMQSPANPNGKLTTGDLNQICVNMGLVGPDGQGQITLLQSQTNRIDDFAKAVAHVLSTRG